MSRSATRAAFVLLGLGAWAMFVVTMTHDRLAAAIFVLALAVSLGAWSSLRWGARSV